MGNNNIFNINIFFLIILFNKNNINIVIFNKNKIIILEIIVII